MVNNATNLEVKLQNLKSYRATNIKNLLNEWLEEDFIDMRKAYTIAKDLASEKGNTLSVKLNEEKLSQLEEAWLLKQTAKKPIPTETIKAPSQAEVSL